MLDSLKKTGEKIGHEISRAWDSLSEGWRELLSRGSDSLTQFTRHKEETPAAGSALATFPSWSLLAGELEETRKDVLVRIDKAQASFKNGVLTVRLPKEGKDQARSLSVS